MKNKWLNIILIICMIIMQRVVIQMSDYEVYQLPFASTLFIFDNQTSNLVQILYAYIPLPFVLFYFSHPLYPLFSSIFNIYKASVDFLSVAKNPFSTHSWIAFL